MRGLAAHRRGDAPAPPSSGTIRALVMACSFQKEESVLIDMLMRIEPCGARVHDRHGRAVPGDLRGLAQGRGPLRAAASRWWTPRRRTARRGAPSNCCGARKVDALERALAGADAWITGIRREQSPTRADAQAVEWDEARERVEVQPAGGLDRRRRVDATCTSTISRTIRCTTGATSRSAALPARCPATAATAAGRGRTRPSAACTSDAQTCPAPILRRDEDLSYEISHLRALESEAIHVIREVAAELERCVLLFSGGKDSAVLLHLARKAFHPGALPFPVMHVDTGHNFPEVIEYRDRAGRGDRRPADRGVGAGLDRQRPRHRGERARAPRATGSSRSRCSTRSRSTASRPPSAARAATRSAPARRSASSPSATTSASGTPRASGPSSGTSTTAS